MAADSFIAGNPDSNTAICTLWTLAKPIADRLPPNSFSMCANLYSLDGINTVIRGICANPKLRYLIITGSDFTHSGDILKHFFEEGLASDGKVKNTSFAFQKEIPVSALEAVRAHVKFFDYRSKSVQDIAALLPTLKSLPAFGKPQEFPLPKPVQLDVFPSEKVGMAIHSTSIADAWLRALDHVMKFGQIKPSEHHARTKEVVDLMCVLSLNASADEPIPAFMPFDAKALKEYVPKLLSPTKPENVVYTYGSRLRERIDQVQNAIDYLKENPHTRRAIAVTWRVEEDKKENANPPCLTQIWWSVENGELHQTVTFRSHDMLEGWPLNMYGLRELQKHVAAETKLVPGKLICLSMSAHIYENKWEEARTLLKDHYTPGAYKFVGDPRGNFVITIIPGMKEGEKLILLQHYTPAGEKTPFIMHSTKTGEKQILEELATQLAHSNLISRIDHAIYLGGELQKAVRAILTNTEYVQDRP